MRRAPKSAGTLTRLKPPHKTGRARMWLTFDDVKTPDGWMPLVAMVDDVPGVHSVRVDFNREGEIEASTTKRQEACRLQPRAHSWAPRRESIAKNEKDAAMGAAAAAAAAYMVASGLGQEVTLEKGTKLELILERSLLFPEPDSGIGCVAPSAGDGATHLSFMRSPYLADRLPRLAFAQNCW